MIFKCLFYLFNLLIILTNTSAKEKNKSFPIQFSIHESKIVKKIPKKTRDFAFIIPGKLNTYIYNDETTYYNGYKESYFAITMKKGGWDCMRHYEILANGCIPYFINLEKCPKNNMIFLPKELIIEAMNLEGVSLGKIDHEKFNLKKYYEILKKILEHTRKYLTTKSMAEYILKTVGYTGNRKILIISDVKGDYLASTTVIGLKELLRDKVIDFPKLDYIYENYTKNTKQLYGKGFSYTKVVEDYPVNRDNIEEQIKNKEFELIIYSTVHWNNNKWMMNNYTDSVTHLFYDTVLKNYPTEKIIYLDGEDCHKNCHFTHLNNFFLREFSEY